MGPKSRKGVEVAGWVCVCVGGGGGGGGNNYRSSWCGEENNT